MRMPRPPPPAEAFTITGKPTCFAHSSASPSLATIPSDPGRIGTPAFFIADRAFSFSPIRRVTSGRGPMNLIPLISQTSAKFAFSASTVSRMNRLHIGDLRRADNAGNVQVAVRQLRRTDTNCLVGKLNVQRIAVRLAVD